ncbi:putative sucrose utilization protein SUC1 [Fulvia fulva]|uniref:Sucrose utilization protein SUC1 n=1 Tax=Passalora fulva TaxID=5499 RepID=A0A9Q8L8A1_PASFU|nr:putative sucrose utilization protein SUC1 [Fulvia fulva]KAK4636201.1 putative sucrose utilization protein SUC1 [Fulvia fulva]KAK4636675.1 putative sucrose utilization protein SUC1 [Fulvia fulva]UJO12626.1 putative sucrose utilization protein SUC1 [Fulvia fulva]WPV08806.1 putative sucrose utilization protein SUC1 [Fulvia fulva]WPV23229.1 putative sucrose utilization protein SUC1 [Fulvia fulva]
MLISTLPGPVEVSISSRGHSTTRTMPEASSSSTPAVKRACDACHRRKVRCIGDGTRPCKNCTSAGLTCTYNAIPQKKGPKGSRAKVISELRETQRQSQLAAKRNGWDLDSPVHSPADLKKAGLLSVEMMTACVDYFFANLYPTQPILHRQRVGEVIGQMETSIEAYCLVVSLCAYMMIQPNMIIPPEAFNGLDIPPQPSFQLGHTLLQEALRVRKGYNYIESPSVWSVITSFFFFGSYFCLDRHNTAWFHLREATTLAQIMGMHEEATYRTTDIIESSRRRRLYWLLFVTERAYALQQHKPLTLHATINLPTLDEDPAETVELNGFIHLVNLFRPFDDTFVGLWNKARVGCMTEWLARLQQQLSEALPGYLQCTESQAVDLRTSQQWLRTMVWQLSIRHGCLSSAASDNAMSFQFPIEVSRDLVSSAQQFTQPAMEIHGIGLIEKLFDVACTLTDVMSVIPHEQYTFEFGPRDYLNQLMTLISTLRGGQQRYLPLLMQKINDTMPNTSGYTIPAIPPTLRSEEAYDANSSAPNSSESTPFGSPLSAGVQPFSSYMDPVVSSGMHFGSGAISAPTSMYGDALSQLAASHALSGDHKYESSG